MADSSPALATMAADREEIHKIGAVLLRDGKLLVVRKYTPDSRIECIIPGGRVERNETHRQTLERELDEELGVKLISMEHFGSFDDMAVFERIPIHMEVYTVAVEGAPEPRSEVKEYFWIGRDYREQGIELGSVLERHVLPKLIERGALL